MIVEVSVIRPRSLPQHRSAGKSAKEDSARVNSAPGPSRFCGPSQNFGMQK